MLYASTLSEVETNVNTGIEYEIAMFYCLLQDHPEEQHQVKLAFSKRADAPKINEIISKTNLLPIKVTLASMELSLYDVSFETQDDNIGPADVVMHVKDAQGKISRIGLSIKFANTCTLNVTGRRFITEGQISDLKRLLPQYSDMYVEEMTKTYGGVNNWFHQRKYSETTDMFVDLIRDAVIQNWPNVQDKTKLLSTLFHEDSPIPFWVITYDKRGYKLRTKPQTIDMSRAGDVSVRKYQTSYVAFYLDETRVAHMQVKFNNGFVEKCKKKNPDLVCQGVRMSYGKPFSSWNFSVEE